MPQPKYARRKDTNHSELVALWLRLGGQWQEGGPLDGWAAWHSPWVPVEIKSGAHRAEGAEDEFTQVERDFMAACGKHGTRFVVWRGEHDVRNLQAVIARGWM